MSGSSATGHCSNVSSTGFVSTCTDPTSSVLFDGVIPILTGLDGEMWASQLLTLQHTTLTRVTFNFADTPGDVGLSGRLEVVMFNCPEKGISTSNIMIFTSASSSGRREPLTAINIGITSCDSLVRVCTPINATQPTISLDFVVDTASDMVYLAEVTFCATSSASTCPPDTIITTAPPDTNITTAPPTTEVPQTVSSTTTSSGTTNTSVTSKGSTNTTATTGSNTITSVIIPVVVVICVVFMIVGIMAAFLILWRYHKHKTSHHTALGEGHSHAHTHSHPPSVKMCEETGQVCHSSPPEVLGQLSSSHDTYSHIQRDATHEGEEIGEYSTLSHGNKPQVLRGGALQPSHNTYSHLQQVNSEGRGGAQSHQGVSNEEREYSALSHEDSPHVLGGGGEDSASQLYAQVDKKAKKKKVTATEMSTLATYSSLDKKRSGVHTPEALGKLYDQVNDKKENGMSTHLNTSESGTTDQLYAQVDKKNKRKKGEMATHPRAHTPEADTAVDHFYAVLEDNREKKKGEVATNPPTPETDAPMDELYAQVDKKRKRNKCDVTIHPEADAAVVCSSRQEEERSM